MSKDEEIRNINARRKNILYLIQRYLQDNGFYSSVEALKTETRLADDYELCDNIDLDSIYLEYASYYHLKFGKYPKVVRKAKLPLKVEVATKQKKSKTQTSPKELSAAVEPSEANELHLVVKRIETTAVEEPSTSQNLLHLQEIDHGSGVCGGGGDELLGCQDWQNLADLVKTTILRDELKLGWADMYGNTKAVEVVKEAVLAPIKYPQLFVNGLKPWRSVLVHGPPGSGKTLLAKILYAETRGQVAFFNITSSIVISKWRGESEKIIKILFHIAQKQAPSIIFFDEIEGLTSRRDRPTDHESSKRFKNELLQLLDGMEQQNSGVFILASTNMPWDIDEAFLRRFEKKLMVQLPSAEERELLINKLLPLTVTVSKAQMEDLVRRSEYFTGDEIRLACKEIAMHTVRRVIKPNEIAGEKLQLHRAFDQITPLSRKLMEKHVQWQKENGAF